MTRDAEHTPTGYEDAASVVVNQAPAPSSLAGGALERAARLIDPKAWEFADKFSTGPHAEMMRAEVKCETAASLRIAGEVLAALSPEAPAEGAGVSSDLLNLKTQLERIAAKPAEEQPCYASGVRPFGAGDLRHFIETLTVAAAALTPCHEAPAEGAGEAMDAGFEAWLNERNLLPNGAWDWPSIVAMLNHHEDALRARSSAPEAREGEAVGYANAEFMRRLKNWRDGVPNSLRADETFLKAVSSESYPVALYTHPAAPSADKLRIAVEALEPFANLGVSSGPDDEPCHYAYRITRGAIRNARQALAALKAEGA